MDKIPKILHFIWFGYMPNYVSFCIENFKKINPTFQINFVHRTPKQLENIYFENKIENEIDQLIFNIINGILNTTYYYELTKQQRLFLSRFGNIPFIQLLADIFRMELLNKYGGIYLDCDTFPIKKFDDEILSYKNFCVWADVHNVKEKNNYFIGSNGKDFIDNYFSDKLTPLFLTNNFMLKLQNKKPFDFKLRRIKFFALKLSNNDFDDDKNYIEHYSDFTWGRKKVEFTKFDFL